MDELVELHSDDSLAVHTADTSCTSVDVFHAYCALAVVRHKLSDWQCSLNCCRDELTAAEVAGLCRLLLWDMEMCRRRCAEELLYIQQLQTNLSSSSDQDLLSISANQRCSQPSEQSDGSAAAADVSDELSSLTPLHDELTVARTGIMSESVGECGATAVDSAEMHVSSDVEGAGPFLHQSNDWHTLPIDVKYSRCELSVALLEQEAERLRHLCDSSSHCMVTNYCF